MALEYPYARLQARLELPSVLPWTPLWSAAEDFLLLLADYCLREAPRYILECGSGLSTLVLARCCQLNGQGQVLSLENGARFIAQTHRQLRNLKLTAHARIFHAPLHKYHLQGQCFSWYRLPQTLPQNIGLLSIDGPPGFLQPFSRYPAVPLLIKQLAPGCLIALDDAARPDEQAIVQRWQAEFPALRDYRYLDYERGCALFRVDKDAL